MNPSSARINWDQLRDVLGEDAAMDPEMAETLRLMWRSMRDDAIAGWPAGDLGGPALGEELHRLRGMLACWGLEGVAEELLAVEKGQAPGQQWRERREILLAGLIEALSVVEGRHPFLAVS